jgi:hypothetical protein
LYLSLYVENAPVLGVALPIGVELIAAKRDRPASKLPEIELYPLTTKLVKSIGAS